MIPLMRRDMGRGQTTTTQSMDSVTPLNIYTCTHTHIHMGVKIEENKITIMMKIHILNMIYSPFPLQNIFLVIYMV